MTDLERARAHLLFERRNLAVARKHRSVFGGLDHHESAVLAALSWVWEEQEKHEKERAFQEWCVQAFRECT
jgi:hypothetical protein